MKRTFIILASLLLCLAGNAQGIRNNGANIVVTSGAWIYIDGDANGGFLNENGGLIDIDGNIVVEGNWTNNAANSVFTNRDNDGWVRFKGTGTETIGGTADTRFEYVEFNNSAGGTPISLSRNMIVEGICRFTDGVVVTGSNYLIIESTTGSDVVGYSNASFVNGNLRRYIGDNTDTYPFPVGDGLTTSDYFLAELINGNLNGVSFNYIDAKFGPLANHNDGDIVAVEETTPYTSVSADGVWFLDPDVAPTAGNYDLKLYTANITSISDNQFAVLSRPTASVTAADWVCAPCGFGDPGVNINGGTGRMVADGYALRLGMSTFSQKGVGKTGAPLPIKLLTFDAECFGDYTVVSWVTSSEINNDYFTIEKSTNGIDFEEITTVQGAGTSNANIEYSIIDEMAMPGQSYYRLKQTDFDNAFEYFGPISVVCAEIENLKFTLYPNPATNQITLALSKSITGDGSIRIFDLSGRLVYSNYYSGLFNRFTINISNLAPGIYYTKLQTSLEDFTDKFIVE